MPAYSSATVLLLVLVRLRFGGAEENNAAHGDEAYERSAEISYYAPAVILLQTSAQIGPVQAMRGPRVSPENDEHQGQTLVVSSNSTQDALADGVQDPLSLLMAPGVGDLTGAPYKSKVVLIVLEIVPILGPLGVDRFYMGNIWGGVIKCLVCICTCGLGGIIWGIIDAIIVIVNCLNRDTNINTSWMTAKFHTAGIETAHTLGWVAIVVQCFCCCGGCGAVSMCFRRFGAAMHK